MREIQPTTVAGIEFDALIESSTEYNSTVPEYPVDAGYSVSDNIALDPVRLKLTLYVTATPVTWLSRHGIGDQRVENICNQLINLYEQRGLVNVTTPFKSYGNMVIKSMTIRDTAQAGYAREIPIEFTQVTVTSAKHTSVPEEYERAGNTMESSGAASTQNAGNTNTSAADRQNGTASGGSVSSSKNGNSMLYNMADAVGNRTGWYSLD